MTLEELLECSASQLEAMTLEQLEEYWKPFLCVTRPELAKIEQAKMTKPSSSKSNGSRSKYNADQLEFEKKFEIARQIAASKGIILGPL